jgi:hypothetical protein
MGDKLLHCCAQGPPEGRKTPLPTKFGRPGTCGIAETPEKKDMEPRKKDDLCIIRICLDLSDWIEVSERP